MRHSALLTLALLAPLCSPLSGVLLHAQQSDNNAPPAPPSSHMGRMGPGMGPGMGREGGDRTGFRFGPMGMWWKNPDLIQKIGLTPDQQKKMDDIFQQSRLQLIDLRANVEKQEVLMEPMLAANPPDTNKILAQIDHTAQARAELEKASARMLLGIRNVLTPDQWTKLQAERGSRRTRTNRGAGPEGPGGPSGPGGESLLNPNSPNSGNAADLPAPSATAHLDQPEAPHAKI